MKTLGQIAFEGFVMVQPTDVIDDPRIQFSSKEEWEAAAQAVRAAVVEECRQLVRNEALEEAERMCAVTANKNNVGDAFHWAGCMDCADAIRALKT